MGYIKPTLTGDEEEVCINLKLPNNPEVLRAFWGQMFGLSNWWVWGEEKPREPEEIETRKAIARTMLELYFVNRDANIEYVCHDESDEDEDDTPWWDDVISMAGAGVGSKWGYEQIADWAVTAFLAVAGSPLAAVWYKTTAPRARLAFQSMDAGSIVNILIDGILFGAVNTASNVAGVAEIIEVPINLVQFAADHSLTGAERIIRLVQAA